MFTEMMSFREVNAQLHSHGLFSEIKYCLCMSTFSQELVYVATCLSVVLELGSRGIDW